MTKQGTEGQTPDRSMSSEASFSSYEMVDVVKEDGPKYREQVERSYHLSHLPVDSTDQIESPAQNDSSLSVHNPTQCSSGGIVTTVDARKVEELAENLKVATRENERYRQQMEECNKVMEKGVEAAKSREQEIEDLKTKLEDYKVKNSELEDQRRSLQKQLSVRVCVWYSEVFCTSSVVQES